jgi:hypothetical protein
MSKMWEFERVEEGVLSGSWTSVWELDAVTGGRADAVMGRWGEGEMGRWGDGETGRINHSVSLSARLPFSPLPLHLRFAAALAGGFGLAVLFAQHRFA